MKLLLETSYINSVYLNRTVRFDITAPVNSSRLNDSELLVIQDGQELDNMGFSSILRRHTIASGRFICVGIHAGIDRIQEYGVSGNPDYLQRGSKAGLYTQFLLHELVPMVSRITGVTFMAKHVLGFSLGGLMAVDIALEHPKEFKTAGAFSGSFWWRSRDLKDGYTDSKDRIIHQKVKKLNANPVQRFFFQAGQQDETADRNKNGIIDSIDDTLDLMAAMKSVGFKEEQLTYLELADGSHDVRTWSRVLPAYLNWLTS
jgi:enterochelin esterase-like enzyme